MEITFTITAEEIREESEVELTDAEVQEILDRIECDEGLASDIQTAENTYISQIVAERGDLT